MRYAYKENVPCLYSTMKDVEDRLNHSIVRYDGKPVFIIVGANWGVEPPTPDLHLYDPRKQTEDPIKRVSPNDPLLDISGIEAMYFNFVPDKQMRKYVNDPSMWVNTVVYMSRNPQKQWKQGLSNYCVTGFIDGSPNQVWDTSNLLKSEGLYDAILGEYPSYHKVLEEFKEWEPGTMMEFAISPDVALRKSEIGVIFVFYRTSMVGWMAPDSTKINVVDTEMKWVIDRYLSRLQII